MTNLSTAFNSLQSSSRASGPARSRASDRSGDLPTEVAEGLRRMELLAAGDLPRGFLTPGSVSAEIYLIELGWGTVCVKRALPKPHRHGTQPPGERNRFEARWLRFARAVIGDAVPEVLGEHDGMFAMDYLDPVRHPTWLALLRDGDISPSTAAEAARLIGRVHASSANNLAVAQRFHTDRLFHQLRIEPMFIAAAQAQPALAERVNQAAASVTGIKLALLHGELVPENILAGPRGPVLIDADCACYGDPAFDAACCLAQLLMLAIWRPQWRDRYLTCFDAFCAAYAQRVTWEIPELTDQRAALLIPPIMLAAVYGDDPVGFLYGPREREVVAAFARKLLVEPVLRLAAVRESWRRSFLG